MSLVQHLVIMARAPRLGAVKRRLAAGIGAVGAWRFYRSITALTLRRVAPDRRWRTWLAVTPDRAALTGRGLWPAPCRVIPQGGGDLGARMGRLFRSLPPGPVVIVGSDIPEIGTAQIARAFRRLGAGDWVFGPAADGGYWLIGARRRPVIRPPFAGVRWSSPRTLADTLANLAGSRVAFLEKMEDIDSAADLARLRARAAG